MTIKGKIIVALAFFINWLQIRRCLYLHRSHAIRLPLYKQGTYEVMGEALFCKKCLKQ